jgi:hypothetical protein
LHVKGRVAAKDEAGSAVPAASKTAAANRTLVSQRKLQQKTQEPPAPAPFADGHPPAPQQHPLTSSTAAEAPAASDQLAADIAAAAAAAAAAGEYSDSSFIYEDNSGSESEQKHDYAAAGFQAVGATPSASRATDENGPGDVVFAAAVR